MSASRNMKAPSAGKKPKSHVTHQSNRSKGYMESHVEFQHAPLSGYQPAALPNHSGYIGASPVEHITDGKGNVISDDEFVSLLGNFQHDSGYSSNLSYDASLDLISHPSSPTPLAPSMLVPGSPLSQYHREISQADPHKATKNVAIHAPGLADTYPLDVVYDKTYHIPSQEQHGDNEVRAPDRGVLSKDSASEALSELQEPVHSAPPRLFQKTPLSSQLQSQAARGWNDRNSRKDGVHERKSIVRPSQPENICSHRSNSKNSWTYNASPELRRDHGYGMTRNQAALNQRYVQKSAQDLPLQTIDSDSEDSYDEVESTPAPREGQALQSRRGSPAAAGKRQSESAPRGETREVNGELQCSYEGQWKYAVRLDEIRPRINAEEKRKGTYDYPWASGKAKNDETSYHPAYKTWGWERDQRPDILFQFERNNHRAPSYSLKTWIDRGRVVLDPDDNPIVLWREIPLLCSSNMSGAELEAISRTNPDIPLSALRARMPAQIVKGQKLRPLFDLNTLRMRMGRFRMKAGCIAWNEREGSKQIKFELAKILGPRCIRENSTRSFGQDLTTAQVDSLKAVNKGTVPQRSRKKRPAETDDESSFAPTPKRQDITLGPFSQEHLAIPAQSVRFGAAFGGQGRARQLNNLVPYSHDRERTNSEQLEDHRGFPSTKQPSAGPRALYGNPYLQQSYGGTGYPQYENPSSDLPSLPTPDVQSRSRKRERLCPDTPDHEADGENASAPMKRRRLDIVPARPNRPMRSAVVDARRLSQMRYGLNAPVNHDSNDEMYHLPDGNLDERMAPFAINEPIEAFPMWTPQLEETPFTEAHNGSLQPSSNNRTMIASPTSSFGTGTHLLGGPLGDDIGLLPALQTNPYLFDEALGDDTTISAAQLPGVMLARQALDAARSHQAQGRNDSDVDFRQVIPRDAAEEESIQKALSFTRDDFETQSGDNPPETSRNQSYETQYQVLQQALADIWLVEGPPPDLFYFDFPWRSFTDWHAPNATHM